MLANSTVPMLFGYIAGGERRTANSGLSGTTKSYAHLASCRDTPGATSIASGEGHADVVDTALPGHYLDAGSGVVADEGGAEQREECPECLALVGRHATALRGVGFHHQNRLVGKLTSVFTAFMLPSSS